MQDGDWEAMCLFHCNEVLRGQEIGVACHTDFLTPGNLNSQYYYSLGQPEQKQRIREKTEPKTR